MVYRFFQSTMATWPPRGTVRAISGSRAGEAIHEAVGVIASDVVELAGLAAWAGAAVAQRTANEMRHFCVDLIPPSIGKCTEGG